MKIRHLDARGKGEHTYDYNNDILLFKVKNRNYLKSIDFDNIIIDLDEEGYITGMRIMDASKILKLSKFDLKNIKNFTFEGTIEDKTVAVQLRFDYERRNKILAHHGQDFIREALDSKIRDS